MSLKQFYDLTSLYLDWEYPEVAKAMETGMATMAWESVDRIALMAFMGEMTPQECAGRIAEVVRQNTQSTGGV